MSTPNSTAAPESLNCNAAHGSPTTTKNGTMVRYKPKKHYVSWSAQQSEDQNDIILNRPASPLAGKPGAFEEKVQYHCEDLTNDPDAPVPLQLEEFAFERKGSCTDVRSDRNPLVEKGRRKVDVWYRAFSHSIGAGGSNGSHARPALNVLTERDKAAIESLQQVIDQRSQSLVVPSVPPGTSVMRTLS